MLKFGFVPKRKDSRDLNVDNHGTEHDCDLDDNEKSSFISSNLHAKYLAQD